MQTVVQAYCCFSNDVIVIVEFYRGVLCTHKFPKDISKLIYPAEEGPWIETSCEFMLFCYAVYESSTITDISSYINICVPYHILIYKQLILFPQRSS